MVDREVGDVPDLEGLKGRAYVVALRAAEHNIYLSKSEERPYVPSAIETNLLDGRGF